jgi:hypothetical protein
MLPAELMNTMLRIMIAIAALTVQSTTCAFSPTVNIDCASRTSLYAATIAKKGCAAVPFEKKKVQSCNRNNYLSLDLPVFNISSRLFSRST